VTLSVFVATFCSVDPAGLPAILDAVQHLHGCAASFVESVPVRETLPDGRVVWDGEVQVLDLVGHPKAKRAYAWSYATTEAKRYFQAVLGLGPVVDARTAVQAAIVADYRKAQN
jgi:hypothetical protein